MVLNRLRVLRERRSGHQIDPTFLVISSCYIVSTTNDKSSIFAKSRESIMKDINGVKDAVFFTPGADKARTNLALTLNIVKKKMYKVFDVFFIN